MHRSFPQARRNPARRAVSAFAMAFALAGGAVVANAAYAPVAAAEDYSDAFRDAYLAVEAPTKTTPADWNAARALIPAMIATVTNDDERSAAGSILLTIGQNLRDVPIQRQALELMLASGKVPATAVGQYQYYVGNFALEMNDLPAARRALQAAIDAGYMPADAATDTRSDPRTQLLRSYFVDDSQEEALALARRMVEGAGPAGTQVPELWLALGLQASIDTENVEGATYFAPLLAAQYPTSRNWGSALRTISQLGDYEIGPVYADVARLMLLTDSMSDRRDYVNYVYSIDSRVMSSETLRVLQAGVEKGLLTTSDQFYTTEQESANGRTAAERRDAPGMAAEARTASTGLEAFEAGEVYFSLGDYANAEEMYALALEKGSQDPARDRMRLAISQVHQGKLAEADANFAQIEGPRAYTAAMWQAYIKTQG